MQPSIQTSPDNSSIEDLRFEKQALEKLVGEQRGRIAALECSAKPERKRLWGRVFGSVAVLVLMVGLTQPLLAGAFDSGNSWLGKPEVYKIGYVAGAVDAFGMAAEWETHDFGWMAECTEAGWTLAQVSAVLEKYLADHPEERHLIAAARLQNAIGKACELNAP